MRGDFPTQVDAIVVGAGAFGCELALELDRHGYSVLLAEREDQPLKRASYHNQARVHQGYHYPRSMLTAMRSRINFSRFSADYGDCIDHSRKAYYAIARTFSKVNARQFRLFAKTIGADIRPAPRHIRELFHPRLIEDVYEVLEPAFDAVQLRSRICAKLTKAGIPVRTNVEVLSAIETAGGLAVQVRHRTDVEDPQVVRTGLLLNCTYAGLNRLLDRSGLDPYTLKHELAEMPLVELPEPLARLCITVMDGPFFSLMPFPARPGLHTLSHVRYTPHVTWWETADESPRADARERHPATVPETRPSNFRYMIADASRYVPALRLARQHDSLWEIKTLLPRSEVDDSRPILFSPNAKCERVISILGGKIDNFYDARERLIEQLAPSQATPRVKHEA